MGKICATPGNTKPRPNPGLTHQNRNSVFHGIGKKTEKPERNEITRHHMDRHRLVRSDRSEAVAYARLQTKSGENTIYTLARKT